MSSPLKTPGPPYLPTTWALGGIPEKNIDIPITAVFMILFIIGAATHMTIFQLNRRRDYKFLFSVVLFGFCMSRIVTCSLRIASLCDPTNTNLSIAAGIFVGAGILILFIVNLIWAQRILRSLHPSIGWHWGVSITYKILYVLIFFTLAINITAVVQTFFTLNKNIRAIDRSLQLYGQTFLAVVSSIPILVVLASLAIPRRNPHEPFGSGTLRTKIIILLAGSSLVTLGAWYRCGTSWRTPVQRSQPLPAYLHRACFYVFNFVVEILTVSLYAVARVDLRFHVPDGAKGPGSYDIPVRRVLKEQWDEGGDASSMKVLREDAVVHQ